MVDNILGSTLDSKQQVENNTRNEWRRCKTTLETSWKDVKLHSKRVGKMGHYTRNEWRRCKATLETSGEDNRKIHLREQDLEAYIIDLGSRDG